jgi:hypothetical protein
MGSSKCKTKTSEKDKKTAENTTQKSTGQTITDAVAHGYSRGPNYPASFWRPYTQISGEHLLFSLLLPGMAILNYMLLTARHQNQRRGGMRWMIGGAGHAATKHTCAAARTARVAVRSGSLVTYATAASSAIPSGISLSRRTGGRDVFMAKEDGAWLDGLVHTVTESNHRLNAGTQCKALGEEF